MTERKRRISGEGAADFLTAHGGEDLPGASPNKGMTDTRDQADPVAPANLEPDLAIDTDAVPHNKERGMPRGRDEQ